MAGLLIVLVLVGFIVWVTYENSAQYAPPALPGHRPTRVDRYLAGRHVRRIVNRLWEPEHLAEVEAEVFGRDDVVVERIERELPVPTEAQKLEAFRASLPTLKPSAKIQARAYREGAIKGAITWRPERREYHEGLAHDVRTARVQVLESSQPLRVDVACDTCLEVWVEG